ncbi:MAG: hypothetical protein AB7G75_31755 [Candidatus Binatia bacterium]
MGQDHDRNLTTLALSLGPPFDGRKIRGVLFAAIVPVALGCGLAWLAPYYVVTCTRNPTGYVDCDVQRTLGAVLLIGTATQIAYVHSVEEFRQGASRTKYGYLRLVGTGVVVIRASRGVWTAALIHDFINQPEAGFVQVSEGNAFFGLYLPWAVALFGLVAAVVTVSDWKEIKDSQSTGFTSAKPVGHVTTYPRILSFVMGAYVMACVAGLVFVYLVDVVRTPILSWLFLISVVGVGGLANLMRVHVRDRRNPTLG